MRIEAERIGFGSQFLERPLNVDLSGGEKKRNETLQLGVLRPAFCNPRRARLRTRRRRAPHGESTSRGRDAGTWPRVLAITHYSRLFEQLKPDVVHVFADGRIKESGGPELATELEETGYERWVTAPAATSAGLPDDPFADPLA